MNCSFAQSQIFDACAGRGHLGTGTAGRGSSEEGKATKAMVRFVRVLFFWF